MPLAGPVPSHISTEFRAPDELLRRTDVAVPQLYQWHAKENPNYPLFVYHDGQKLEYVTYSQANRAMDRAARYVASSVSTTRRDASAARPVVALFANTGQPVLRTSCWY